LTGRTEGDVPVLCDGGSSRFLFEKGKKWREGGRKRTSDNDRKNNQLGSKKNICRKGGQTKKGGGQSTPHRKLGQVREKRWRGKFKKKKWVRGITKWGEQMQRKDLGEGKWVFVTQCKTTSKKKKGVKTEATQKNLRGI